MPDCNSDDENDLVNRARQVIAVYEDMAEMIRLGTYRPGSDADVDHAIRLYPEVERFLAQDRHERSDLASGYRYLAAVFGGVEVDA